VLLGFAPEHEAERQVAPGTTAKGPSQYASLMGAQPPRLPLLVAGQERVGKHYRVQPQSLERLELVHRTTRHVFGSPSFPTLSATPALGSAPSGASPASTLGFPKASSQR